MSRICRWCEHEPLPGEHPILHRHGTCVGRVPSWEEWSGAFMRDVDKVMRRAEAAAFASPEFKRGGAMLSVPFGIVIKDAKQ